MCFADAGLDPQRLRVGAVQMQQLLAILQRQVEPPLSAVLTRLVQQKLFVSRVGQR